MEFGAISDRKNRWGWNPPPPGLNRVKQTELTRLEQLQYRAAKLVTGVLHFSSREKLKIELGWESIQKRIEFLGLSLFQKIHLYGTRPLIRK